MTRACSQSKLSALNGLGMAEQRAGHFQLLHSALSGARRACKCPGDIAAFVADGAVMPLGL